MESTTIEHSGSEEVGEDADGNAYEAVMRQKLAERRVKDASLRVPANR